MDNKSNNPRRNNRNNKSKRSNYSHSNRSNKQNYTPSRRVISEAEQKFLAGTPINPEHHVCLAKGMNVPTMRAVDLICPIGFGQRGLIVAPPGSGKTTLLKNMCQAIATAEPEARLYCLLIDERPEEVTDFKRSVDAEVRFSSSDHDYEHHIKTADQLMQDAFKEASQGKDVVLLIDSLTRLSRVHNAEQRSSGRTMSGGVDARALEVPRRIFGAARNIEEGGSLTIIATILIETGSRMDEVIFEEFKGTGNMEIVLSRDIANRRIYPAIDIAKSGTRKQEILISEDILVKMDNLRRKLLETNSAEAANTLIEYFKKYSKNEELLEQF